MSKTRRRYCRGGHGDSNAFGGGRDEERTALCRGPDGVHRSSARRGVGQPDGTL